MFRAHQDCISDTAFSADNKRLLTSSPDGFAKVWDIETGRLLQEMNHCKSDVYVKTKKTSVKLMMIVLGPLV